MKLSKRRFAILKPLYPTLTSVSNWVHRTCLSAMGLHPFPTNLTKLKDTIKAALGRKTPSTPVPYAVQNTKLLPEEQAWIDFLMAMANNRPLPKPEADATMNKESADDEAVIVPGNLPEEVIIIMEELARQPSPMTLGVMRASEDFVQQRLERLQRSGREHLDVPPVYLGHCPDLSVGGLPWVGPPPQRAGRSDHDANKAPDCGNICHHDGRGIRLPPVTALLRAQHCGRRLRPQAGEFSGGTRRDVRRRPHRTRPLGVDVHRMGARPQPVASTIRAITVPCTAVSTPVFETRCRKTKWPTSSATPATRCAVWGSS